jgi:hypothetical protein
MSIDEFLDIAFTHLAGTGGAGRRALTEAEDHLRTAAAAKQAQGAARDAAEAAAVARFGDPVDFARRISRGETAAWAPLVTGAWALGGILAVAVGVAGGLAELFGDTLGPAFVAGDRYGVTYQAWRCAEYLHLAPAGSSCSAAAAFDHWGEVVEGRVAVGVLGLLALLLLALVRRTFLREADRRIPWAAVAAAGAIAFVLAAVVRGLPDGATALLSTTTGTGAGLADALSSAVFAIGLLVVAIVGRHRILLPLRRSPAADVAG